MTDTRCWYERILDATEEVLRATGRRRQMSWT